MTTQNSYGGKFDDAFLRAVRRRKHDRRMGFGDVARLVGEPTETVRHWIKGITPINDVNRARLAGALCIDSKTGEDRCEACGGVVGSCECEEMEVG